MKLHTEIQKIMYIARIRIKSDLMFLQKSKIYFPDRYVDFVWVCVLIAM